MRHLTLQKAVFWWCKTRFRLEGAIVKFTSRTLSPERETPRAAEREAYHKPLPQPRIEKRITKKRSSRSWIAWLLILAALAASAYFLYPKYESSFSSDA